MCLWKNSRQPHVFFSVGNEETLWFAGLLSVWNDLRTCAVLTRVANDAVMPIHDRMLVILDSVEREGWLTGSDRTDLGAAYRVRHHPVTRFGIGDEGEALIAPILENA